jgi:hypothetical protein
MKSIKRKLSVAQIFCVVSIILIIDKEMEGGGEGLIFESYLDAT